MKNFATMATVTRPATLAEKEILTTYNILIFIIAGKVNFSVQN
jgi:hypothetical protein